MCKVLVFSKNRPMQLYAYLGSFFLNSYSQEKQAPNISVLYFNEPPFDYSDVIKTYPVNWIHENNFNYQVRKWIEDCEDEFVMFGCDDVIFRKPFSLDTIEHILKEHNDIFGFSLRLGKNINGFPEDVAECNLNCFWNWYYWNWNSFEIDDFHYPWELDCTVYRTSDVKDMINKYQRPFINPNYFEEFVTFDWDYYIKRPKLACFEYSKAFVLTINRVQDTHPNYYDDNCPSLEQLNDMYQQGYRIKAFALPSNDRIHVGSEYLKLLDFRRENEEE